MNSKILQNIRYPDKTLNKFRKTQDPNLYKKYIANLGTLCNELVVLEIDGETCFDPKKVANCFNEFFLLMLLLSWLTNCLLV